MMQPRSFDTFSSARVSCCALALAVSGCGVDLPLGELDSSTSSQLVDDQSSSAPIYEDGITPVHLTAPELTLGLSTETPTFTQTMSVGDMDGDGFDDMAAIEYDAGSKAHFIHLRYGSPRPSDAVAALEFGEGGARLLVQDPDAPAIIVGGVHPVGDFDADGYADVFVQMWGDDPVAGNGGYLLYGGPERLSGIQRLGAIAAHIDAGARPSNAYATYSFAALGDIDGDGFADLAMTNPLGTALEPGVYVFYGRTQRLAAVTPWSEAELRLAYPPLQPRIIDVGRDDDGDGVSDYVQENPQQPSLSSGGDIDGDGFAELLVTYTAWQSEGAPVDNRVIIIRGTSTRLTGTLDLLELQPQITDADAQPGDYSLTGTQAAGDIDADGRGDFIVTAWSTNYLFYGGAELLSGPIAVSEAAASLADVNLVAVGDRDGDGDDELMARRWFADQADLVPWPELQASVALATLSGSRARFSGNVEVLSEPGWEDAQVFPGVYDRLAYNAVAAGDLDHDGAADLITWSRGRPVPGYIGDSSPQMHVHYGVHVPPATPAEPR